MVDSKRGSKKGALIRPTVLFKTAVQSRVFIEEIFGPVVNVWTFEIKDEVVCLANNTQCIGQDVAKNASLTSEEQYQ